MKYGIIFLFSILMALLSNSCSTSSYYYPASIKNIDASEESIRDGPRSNRRANNKRLMKYIEARTVLISVDCTPKKGVVVVGTSNPNRYGDGWGSGIIVQSRKGRSYIFTAAHVVEFSDRRNSNYFNCKINVQLERDAGTNKNIAIASMVSKNTGSDIAVIRVPVDFGVNTALEVEPFTGEDVWAAGFPIQKMSTKTKVISITKGTLATLNVPANRKSSRKYHRVTSQIYFGNSGGGIWNKEGKLLSIVSSLFAGVGKVPYEGYYYTKPVKEVIQLLSRKLKYKEVFGDLK